MLKRFWFRRVYESAAEGHGCVIISINAAIVKFYQLD
jgi:hypothetical protein